MKNMFKFIACLTIILSLFASSFAAVTNLSGNEDQDQRQRRDNRDNDNRRNDNDRNDNRRNDNNDRNDNRRNDNNDRNDNRQRFNQEDRNRSGDKEKQPYVIIRKDKNRDN